VRPRPVILLTFAYGAGLATGLARIVDPWTLIPLLIVGVLGRKTLSGFVCLAALLGGAAGALAKWEDGFGCAARLPSVAVSLTVVLEEPVSESGGVGLASPVGAGCHGVIAVRWPVGSAAIAGSRVRVTGRWIKDPESGIQPGGLFLVQRSSTIPGRPSLPQRLKSWIRQTSATLYGTRAGIVDALVLNARGGMSQELRDQYTQSGLVHILSISGFHVGLIAAWVLLLLRGVGVARIPAMLGAAGVSVLYVLFLGWPPPAARAAALATLLAFCRARQRQPQTQALLAATCLGVMVIDPWSVLDLSTWLSAGALWGAVTFGRWSDRALGSGWWWRMLSSSLGATLATAPITAGAFGTVSLAGIILNFLAIPLAALAVPGILGSLIMTPLSAHVAASLATGSGLALEGLDLLARWGSHWPGACVWLPAEWKSSLPWLAVLAVALWGMAGGTTATEALRRWALTLTCAIWAGNLAALYDARSDNASDLTLHFLDVGQGDAAVLRTPGGHWVVVDAGPRSDKWDAGRRVVAPYLARHRAARIDVLVISHAHADHLGGVPALLDRYDPGLILEPGEPVRDPLYLEFLDRVAAHGLVWRPGRPGDHFEVDGVRFSVLHPDTGWTHWREDLNEDSLVLLVEYGAFQALFAGDAGVVAESLLIRRAGAVDLLKVGHHGSRTASSNAWLDRLQAKAAVLSVGKINRYGHPNPETLERLSRHGMAIWRTDRDGTVDVETDGRSMIVRGRGRAERYDVTDTTH
jgi:competence protein ComEC